MRPERGLPVPAAGPKSTLCTASGLCYNGMESKTMGGLYIMKHVKTLGGATLNKDLKKAGCGECQTSCQSACKTSCTVANQKCERK